MSKTNKDHAKRVEKYRETVKKGQERSEEIKNATKKEFIVPQPEWMSNENLDIRGDFLEAYQITLMQALDTFQTLYGQMQKLTYITNNIIKLNLDSGKAKMSYIWNNGEIPTEEDVKVFEKQLADAREAATKQQESLQNQAIAEDNASKTGLVDVTGEPLGSNVPLGDAPTIITE